MTTWRLAAGAVLVAAAVAGCGPRHGHVSGSVTVDGRPLDYGMVNFVGRSGAASAPVNAGTYEASMVPPGPVGITVRAMPRPAVADPAAGGALPFAPLPDRYLAPERSGLTLDVVAGRQRHDIAVSAK